VKRNDAAIAADNEKFTQENAINSENILTNPDKYDIINIEVQNIGESNVKIGDTDGTTTITDIRPIDFYDEAAIMKEIEDFCAKYAYADVEYALEIAPTGKAYNLTGIKGEVHSEIIGNDALNGSISIHNHPVEIGKNKGDSFSIKDLRFATENNLGKQYLVSGNRRDAFEFINEHTFDEISTAWKKAYNKVSENHWNNETEIAFEQEETLRELHKYLKGFKFYENF